MTQYRLQGLLLGALSISVASLALAAGQDAPPASREASAPSAVAPLTLAGVQARAEAAFRARDYAGTLAWGQRYLRDGGADPRIHALLGRSSYFSNDFENAARSLHVEVALAERASQMPPEDGLKLLATSYARLNDMTGQIWALEKLVTYFPKKEHWAELILQTAKRASFSEALALDLWRLKFVTDTLESSRDFLQASMVALNAGFPADAKAMLDKGFASGALGTGIDADSHRRLREAVARQYTEARKAALTNPSEPPASSPHFGSQQVDAGLRLVGFGDAGRGIAMMERALQQAGSNRPQIDKLHLGIAYLMAGRKVEAMATFKTVTGVHGAADLGRLWYLQALRSSLN